MGKRGLKKGKIVCLDACDEISSEQEIVENNSARIFAYPDEFVEKQKEQKPKVLKIGKHLSLYTV